MAKIIVLLFLVFLSGCSFQNLFLEEEINKLTVVTYTPYMKHHRAFFARSDLRTLKNKQKYLYLYQKKNNTLAVLLRQRNQFLLYALSNPKQQVSSFNTPSYASTRKRLNKLGYNTLSSPLRKGFVVSVSRKRYKNVKTLLFEVKEYTRLQNLYKNAIHTYDASKIRNIKTKLPKALILSYYRHYEQQAKNQKQLEQLQIIAKKLQIKSFILPKKIAKVPNTQVETKKTVLEKEEPNYEKETEGIEEIEVLPIRQVTQLPYTYYLNTATLAELSTHLSKKTTRKSLSPAQYSSLKQRKQTMQEHALLEEGSLEELIAAYKVNKKEKFKQRILSRMKEKQQQ